jgi:hypothetical protein
MSLVCMHTLTARVRERRARACSAGAARAGAQAMEEAHMAPLAAGTRGQGCMRGRRARGAARPLAPRAALLCAALLCAARVGAHAAAASCGGWPAAPCAEGAATHARTSRRALLSDQPPPPPFRPRLKCTTARG